MQLQDVSYPDPTCFGKCSGDQIDGQVCFLKRVSGFLMVGTKWLPFKNQTENAQSAISWTTVSGFPMSGPVIIKIRISNEK